MVHLLYLSEVSGDMIEQDLLGILDVSRDHNRRLGVTGLLLYRRNTFMQLLEGAEDAVETLYGKISNDSRHKNCLVIYRGQTQARLFPDWSMGFECIAIGECDGYIDYFNESGSVVSGGVVELLDNFREYTSA